MSERALATIREVGELRAIEGADRIEAARIDGWWVVVKKNEFFIGEYVVYFEIDSWIPHSVASFLTKVGNEPRFYQGVPGQRLRTARLRGQLSQGLVLPLTVLPDDQYQLRTDVTEILGVLKWEPELSAQLRGVVKSTFPHFIPKTDQERIQNSLEVLRPSNDNRYEITLKLDGTSVTIYIKDGCPGVCSRNMDLKLTAENAKNLYIKTARKSGLLEAIMCYQELTGKNIAVQGELMGPGVQGNRENLKYHKIFIFDIYDIDVARYLNPNERVAVVNQLELLVDSNSQFDHIPYSSITFFGAILKNIGIKNIEDMLDLPMNPTRLGFFGFWTTPYEGIVFKPHDVAEKSFKVINNEFLESEK